MLKGLGDMAGMMAKAKEMQAKMEEMQGRIADIEAEGEAGAGLVTAKVTGEGVVKGLNIDQSIFQPSEKEVVEDLILAAIKDAREKADRMAAQEKEKLTEGLGLPPGMNLPF